MKKTLSFLAILLLFTLIFFNIVRFLNAAFRIAGFENDSGWYFGLAANLGLRGKYATSTDPVVVQDNPLVTRDMWGRRAVVDTDGRDYFSSGVSVGPAFLFPVALAVKLWGVGYWQFRLFPILTCLILLFSLIWLSFKFSGLLAGLLMVLFLNLFPQLMITIALEGLGEPTGFLYLLGGAFFFSFSLQARKKKERRFFLAGIFFALAVLTKTLYLLNLPALLFFYFFFLERKRKQEILSFFIGFMSPILLFEVYRFSTLYRLGGSAAYWANLAGKLTVILDAGSGLRVNWLRSYLFPWQKLIVFREIGLRSFFLIPAFFYFWFLFLKKTRTKFKQLFWLLTFYCLINYFWFFLFSSTGWARHFWPGLILTLLFLSVYLGKEIPQIFLNGINPKKIITILLLLSLFSFFSSDLLSGFSLKAEILDKWRDKFFSSQPQGLPAPIFSLKEQKEVVNFIKEGIPPQTKIFYVEGFLVAEIPPLVDRVFHSVKRTDLSESGPAVVIFGPYQVSSYWRIIPLCAYADQLNQYCGQEIFNNLSYKICLIKMRIEADKENRFD